METQQRLRLQTIFYTTGILQDKYVFNKKLLSWKTVAVGPVCEEFTDCDMYDTVQSAACLRPALISEDGRQQASLQLTCAAPESR